MPRLILAILIIPLLTAAAMGQPCHSFWAGTGAENIFGRSLTVFDDGNGPRLYVAGPDLLQQHKGVVWRWDGRTWEDINTGLPHYREIVDLLLSLDFGDGPELHVHVRRGAPINKWFLMRWTGQSWVAARDGLLTTSTWALSRP